eukprot:999240-Ditylum_brightwellii.AAC.1
MVSKYTISNDEVLYLYFRKDESQLPVELLRVKSSKTDEGYDDLLFGVYKKNEFHCVEKEYPVGPTLNNSTK